MVCERLLIGVDDCRTNKGLDKNTVHKVLTNHLCKTNDQTLVCGAKSELILNLSGFGLRLEIKLNFLNKVKTEDEL